MRIPIVFPVVVGASEKIERTGASFHGECPACKATGPFHEAKKRFNVSAFGALSLWDSDEPVVQCGACNACFEPKSIPRLKTPSLLGRIAGALKGGASGSDASRPEPAAAQSKTTSDDEIDAELAALKKRLGKD